MRPIVVWHDVECHGYTADLPLWRELAAAEAGPVLDVGAGTGRVALDLAARGHEVVALDIEPELLAALRERAAARLLTIETAVADAAGFYLRGRTFRLIVVPMQTIQLVPGADGRAAFLAAARRHLRPGGLVAAAIADALEGFDDAHTELPAPDVGTVEGWRFSSQPIAVRARPDALTIERVRSTRAPDGRLSAEADAIELARVTVAQLEAEAAAAGLAAEPACTVAATDEHVGSQVVMLRG